MKYRFFLLLVLCFGLATPVLANVQTLELGERLAKATSYQIALRYLAQAKIKQAANDTAPINGVLINRALNHQQKLALIKLLVKKGANVNAASRNGSFPLLNAIFHGDAAIITYLVSQGANVRQTNTRGYSLHYIARCSARHKKARLLHQLGAPDREGLNESYLALLKVLNAWVNHDYESFIKNFHPKATTAGFYTNKYKQRLLKASSRAAQRDFNSVSTPLTSKAHHRKYRIEVDKKNYKIVSKQAYNENLKNARSQLRNLSPAKPVAKKLVTKVVYALACGDADVKNKMISFRFIWGVRYLDQRGVTVREFYKRYITFKKVGKHWRVISLN